MKIFIKKLQERVYSAAKFVAEKTVAAAASVAYAVVKTAKASLRLVRRITFWDLPVLATIVVCAVVSPVRIIVAVIVGTLLYRALSRLRASAMRAQHFNVAVGLQAFVDGAGLGIRSVSMAFCLLCAMCTVLIQPMMLFVYAVIGAVTYATVRGRSGEVEIEDDNAGDVVGIGIEVQPWMPTDYLS